MDCMRDAAEMGAFYARGWWDLMVRFLFYANFVKYFAFLKSVIMAHVFVLSMQKDMLLSPLIPIYASTCI